MNPRKSADHHRQKAREHERAYRKRHPGAARLAQRRYKFKHVYGITEEQYDQMLIEQAGVCKLCGGPPIGRGLRLHVDHDHATGKVRGLLCSKCNTALGLLSDDSTLMAKAIAYVNGAC